MISSALTKGRNSVFVSQRRDGAVSTAPGAAPAPRNLLQRRAAAERSLGTGAKRAHQPHHADHGRATPQTGLPHAGLLAGSRHRAETWPPTRDASHQEQGCSLLLHAAFEIQLLLLSRPTVFAQSPPARIADKSQLLLGEV